MAGAGVPLYFDSEGTHYYESLDDAAAHGHGYNYIVGFKSLKPDLVTYPDLRTYTDEWTDNTNNEEQELRITCTSFKHTNGIVKLQDAEITLENLRKFNFTIKAGDFKIESRD